MQKGLALFFFYLLFSPERRSSVLNSVYLLFSPERRSIVFFLLFTIVNFMFFEEAGPIWLFVVYTYILESVMNIDTRPG